MVELRCALCGKLAVRWESPPDVELCGECEQLKTYRPQQFAAKVRDVLAAEHARYLREHAACGLVEEGL